MKKFFKILLIIFGVILGMILLLIAGVLLWTLNPPHYDVSPSAYHWPKNMTSFQIDSAAHMLLKEMTLEEKVDQMDGDGTMVSMLRFGVSMLLFKKLVIQYAGRNERLDIPPIAFSDGPRGITIGHSTAFPVAMARGASFDTDLEKRVGDAIGKEARAQGVNYFGGVCINLLRHPAWGRAQETFGEDPFHLSQMVVALTHGVQAHHVMACAKHYAMNSVECARFYIDVKADERTLHEVYLPHFKSFVNAGGASIMSAYNKVNGLYCGNNPYLLTNVLRDQWGFQGIISSDWVNGVRDGKASVRAGLDIEMPVGVHYGDSLLMEVRNGNIEEHFIDSAVIRILRTKLKYITAGDPMDYSKSLVASPEHTALAREAAEKSIVLLKNENNLLPLKKENIKKIAVIGRLADEPNLGDRGSSSFMPPYVVTPLKGLKNYLGDHTEIIFTPGREKDEVKKAAESADVVIVIVGYDFRDEGEYITFSSGQESRQKTGVGGDRLNLTLHEQDEQLIREVAAVNPKCVVGMIGGGAIIVENWKEQVPAILMLWYPGMEGGNAFARILFGEVNPSGKLPFTVPLSVTQLPWFNAFTDTITYGLYHGYTLMDKYELKPAYPFGFGLSYTQFQYDSLWLDRPETNYGKKITAFVKLTNTGSVKGTEVVQLYAGFRESSIDRPMKLLRGFKRITLEPGESGILEFEMNTEDLAWYNPDPHSWEVEKMNYEVLAGPSSDERHLLRTAFLLNE